MPNEKTRVDQWVRKEIENLGVEYTEQTSSIKEVKNALKKASKQGGTGVGKPEFVFLINDTLIVVEDKPHTSELELLDENGELDLTVPNATAKYAVNGAVHYAKHIVEKTVNFKDIIAIGATGDTSNRSVITYHVNHYNEKLTIKKIGDLNDWQVLTPINFSEWYGVNVLGNLSKEQKDELELKKIATVLHEDLRNYASLEGENKATVISAILLALNETSFDIDSLKGNKKPNDGRLIYRAIEDYMSKNEISPEFKVETVMNKFSFIKTNIALNTKRKDLGMTPIKYFANILKKEVLEHFKNNTEFDILGNFYGEFVKYGGGDGNGLGIVLTPKHITSLMSELIQVNRSDYVLDPTAGSGAFLISAMNRMINEKLPENSKFTNKHIKKHQLFGIELQEKMYTVATTNMILRGDGKSNLMLADMFSKSEDSFAYNNKKIDISKILMNPPYSQGSKENPNLYEINFIQHALELMSEGGKLAAIVPQSTMIGKTTRERKTKEQILKENTLEAVITLNPNTFQGQRAGVQPVIAIFTAKQEHPIQKKVKFINFVNDGWSVEKHVGLINDGTAEEKRKYLIDVILHDEDAVIDFLVKSKIKADDEWLHSFFYFNDSIPNEDDFKITAKDYITHNFIQTINQRDYLFNKRKKSTLNPNTILPSLHEKEWKTFEIQEIFEVEDGFYNKKPPMTNGDMPFLGATENNYGITGFTDIECIKSSSKNGDTVDNTLNRKIFGPNWIAVTNNGSVGNVYFMESEYTSSHDVTSLYIKDKVISIELGLFLTTLLKEAGKPFSYGRKWRPKRMRKTKLNLPIDNQNKPDWDYMESYMFFTMSNYDGLINTFKKNLPF